MSVVVWRVSEAGVRLRQGWWAGVWPGRELWSCTRRWRWRRWRKQAVMKTGERKNKAAVSEVDGWRRKRWKTRSRMRKRTRERRMGAEG